MCRLSLALLLTLSFVACAAGPDSPPETAALSSTEPAPAGESEQANPPANHVEAPQGSRQPQADRRRYRALGRNAQGYEELLRKKDGATVVLIPGGPFAKRAYWDTPGTEEREEGWMLEMRPMLFDKHEVTNAQVARFLANSEAVFRADATFAPDGKTPWAITHPWGLRITSEGAHPQPGFEHHPAVGTSGWLAKAYAEWVGGALPTGTEYEYAAAGPSGLLFPWGNEDKLPDSTRANSLPHGPRRTMPVGSFPAGASPFGLLDMAGNVYNRAYWDGDQPTAEGIEDLGQPTMLKGGAWVSASWWNLRCVCRCGQNMDAMEGSVGFRIMVRDAGVLSQFVATRPRMRVLTDTWAAYEEASYRNVPIFLYLGYER
jgi:formylglycine-generating enzyme required for sulfatase activity